MSVKNHDSRFLQLRHDLAELPADERYLIEEAGRIPGGHASFLDFIVIGAPRAGTTWLFELLRNHPDVFLSPFKELKYFTSRYRNLRIIDYQQLFSGSQGRLRGDISPTYFLLPRERIEVLKTINPNLKIIYSLRDPVQRAWSHIKHVFATTGRLDELSDPEAIRRYALSEVPVLGSRYSLHLWRWLQVFDSSRLLVIFQEDIGGNPAATSQKVLDFLGLAGSVNLEQHLNRVVHSSNSDVPLDHETHSLLEAIFELEYTDTGRLLERQFGLTIPATWRVPKANAAPLQLARYGLGSDLYLWRGRFVLLREGDGLPGDGPDGLTDASTRATAVSCYTLLEAEAARILDVFNRRLQANLCNVEPDDEPLLLEPYFHGFNLVYWGGMLFAVRVVLGHLDLATIKADDLVKMLRDGSVLVANNLEALRQKVQKRLDHDLRAIELVLEQVDSNADPLSSDGLADIDFSARTVAALASKEEEEGQHATFKLTRCVQLVGQEQPWRTFPHAVQQINPIPSFICEDESRFLAWYCASEYSGQGAIVDMGPLGGGSTHSMAFGLAKNPRATMSERIHSYDLWTYFPDWSGLFPGEAIKPGEDLSPHFVSNLGDFATRVRLHKGDIRQHSWNGRPIEILFLDAAKEPGVMLHVVNAFYPFLIPGRSIVIQQDLVSAECPWIHIAQEHLAPFFEVIDSPDGGTVCFRLRHRIPINSLPPDFFDELSVATGTRLISTMARRLRGWYALCVYLAGANYVGMKGYKALSLRMVAAVKSSMHYNPNVENDIRLVTERVSASDP